MKHSRRKSRWFPWTLGVIAVLIIAVLGFVTKTANQRYDAAMLRLDTAGSPQSLDELYARQNIDPQAIELELERLAPMLQEQYEKVVLETERMQGIQIYDDAGMTAEGADVVRGILTKNPKLLEETLALSRRDYFWSRARFESIDGLRTDSYEELSQRCRTVARFLSAIAWFEMSQDRRNDAMESALGILRISNRLSDQPLIEQLKTSLVLKKMSLMLMNRIISSGPVEPDLLREAADTINDANAHAVWQAMLETECAARLTDHRERNANVWFNTNAVADMVEMIETSRMPPEGNGAPTMNPQGTISKLVSLGKNAELRVLLNTFATTRSEVDDLENGTTASIKEMLATAEKNPNFSNQRVAPAE